jgi:hypothetical protein
MKYAFYSVICATVVLSCFIKFLISHLLQLLTSLTTITIYAFLSVPLSGLAQVVTRFIFDYSQFNIIDVNDALDVIFEFPEEESSMSGYF